MGVVSISMLDELSTPGLSEAQTPGIQAGKAGILNYIHPGRFAARIDAEDAGIRPISATQKAVLSTQGHLGAL